MLRWLLLSFLLAPAVAAANPPNPAYVRFEGAPTLRQVTARRQYPAHSDQSRLWRRRTKAAVEFAAMARELYGGRTMTFIARDGLLLHHVLDYLAADEEAGPKLKLVAFSGNATTGHPQLPAYLRDSGLAPEAVGDGGCAFFDCAAGSGRTFDRFRELSDPGAVGHVLASTVWKVPPLRIALLHFDRRAGSMLPHEQIGVSHAVWEWDHIAHPTGTIAEFADHGGRVEAFGPPSAPEVQAESLRWKEHVRHLLDGGMKRRYERRRPLWRQVRQLADAVDTKGFLRLARAQFDEHRPETAEALARDIVHAGLTNFWPLAKALQEQLGDAAFAQLWSALGQPESIRGALTALEDR